VGATGPGPAGAVQHGVPASGGDAADTDSERRPIGKRPRMAVNRRDTGTVRKINRLRRAFAASHAGAFASRDQGPRGTKCEIYEL